MVNRSKSLVAKAWRPNQCANCTQGEERQSCSSPRLWSRWLRWLRPCQSHRWAPLFYTISSACQLFDDSMKYCFPTKLDASRRTTSHISHLGKEMWLSRRSWSIKSPKVLDVSKLHSDMLLWWPFLQRLTRSSPQATVRRVAQYVKDGVWRLWVFFAYLYAFLIIDLTSWTC